MKQKKKNKNIKQKNNETLNMSIGVKSVWHVKHSIVGIELYN